jgi:hypothetical protein
MTKTHLFFEFEKNTRQTNKTANTVASSSKKAKSVKNPGVRSNLGQAEPPIAEHFQEKESLHLHENLDRTEKAGPSSVSKRNSSPVPSTSRGPTDPRILLRTTAIPQSPPISPRRWSIPSPTVVIDIEPSSSSSNPLSRQDRWAWPRNVNEVYEDAESSSPVARRRLAQRQRKIIPVHNEGAKNGILTKVRRKKISKRKGCGWSACVSKCFPEVGESSIPCCNNTKEKLRKLYADFIKKKKKWDRWNPSKDHPLVTCIDESKLAGLKETIKPNRGIIYRYSMSFNFFNISTLRSRLAVISFG